MYFTCACSLCGLFLFAAPVHAEWIPDGTALCSLPGGQLIGRAVSDGSNGAIIVWNDNRSASTGTDIYVQRVDMDGNVLWMPEGVAVCTAAGSQYNPRLCSDGAGGAVIVWLDASTGKNDIYAQRIDASGNVLWTTNGVAVCTETDNQVSPTPVPDGGGGAIIAWQDYRSGTYYDIYAQRIAGSNGAQLWAAGGREICIAANSQYYPEAVSDGTGGAIITWQDYRGGNYDIYAQHVNTAGVRLWTLDGVVVTAAANNQVSPKITSDGAGGAIIAWHDYRSGSNYDVYTQRMTSGGTASWTANGVAVCTAANSQSDPQLIADGSGGAIISWQDGRGADSDIYGQRVNSSGTALWTANGVLVCGVVGSQSRPALASDGSGGAIIAWEDYRTVGSSDIYAQKVHSTGVVQWSATGIAISSAFSYQEIAQIVSDNFGGAVIAWQDDRSGSYDIYAGHVDGDGNAGWTNCGVPISTAASYQTSVRIISDGSEGAIMAWEDFRDNPDASDIYAQRVFSDGSRLWSKQGFPVTTVVQDQMRPAIAPDGAGGVLVTWEDTRNGNYDIYAQHVGSIQNIYWRLNGAVVCSTTAGTYYPQMVSDGASGAIVVWENLVGGGTSDIYAQRLNSSGSQLWPAAGVAICSATNHQNRPQVITDGAGGAIISWMDYRTGAYDVYAQRVDANGNALWLANGVLVCGATGGQTGVKMVTDGAGGAIICWTDSRGAAYDVYARRVNASGTVLWTSNGVAVCTATGNQYGSAIVSDGAGGAIISWEDYRGSSADVYAQRLNASGTPLWDTDGVVASAAAGEQTTVDIATDGNSGAIISWQDRRSGVTSDVYAQRLDSDGDVLWETNGIVICASDRDDTWPVLTHSAAGQAIVAWDHLSSTTSDDIYAQSTSYIVAVPEEPAPPAISSYVAELDQNYPNPFNPVTKIAFTLRDAGSVRLCVYDIAGRVVRVLEEGLFAAGRHEVVWDGKDSTGENVASGVYFYRLETPQTASLTESKKMVIVR
jgi:hypothetical protein